MHIATIKTLNKNPHLAGSNSAKRGKDTFSEKVP